MVRAYSVGFYDYNSYKVILTTSIKRYEYNVYDENLKEEIKNARKYAKELVEEFLKELIETSKVAAKGSAINSSNYAVGWAVAGIFLTIIGSLIKTSN